ncbi:MAG: CXXX repeat peptide maturase [Paraprevotella sp.]|nr:CXXX repeat peptide maturase [Paraprevotella sp.]
MLQYLIIQLDDTSTSYCHYENGKMERRLMALEDLKAGILFAMKENLMIQFVYPDYVLPQEYKDAINSIDHNDIVSSSCEDMSLREKADVVVFNSWASVEQNGFQDATVCVLRTTKADLLDKYLLLKPVLSTVTRLNVVITDVDTFTGQDFEDYKKVLASLSEEVEKLYIESKSPQLNQLTDRMLLDKMNNCNAGWENITLAPDGKFYVCPAFYLAGDDEDFGLGKAKYSIGDLQNGLDVKNPQLYKLEFAPLCRKCDAYQCKRCVWLNRKTTYEVNTPSHEQCVVAHLERNASRDLLNNIRKHGTFFPQREEIKEITYLDPFDIKEQ